MAHPHGGTRRSHGEERSPDTCHDVDGPRARGAEWTEPAANGHMASGTLPRVCEPSRRGESTETESRGGGCQGQGDGVSTGLMTSWD